MVASLPQRSAAGLRFRFEVDAAQLDGQPVQVPRFARARLVQRLARRRGADSSRRPSCAPASAGRFTLRLRQPHGNLNPHGFDYELQLFEQGVRATGAVRDAPAPVLLHAARATPSSACASACATPSKRSVPDRRAAGVLAALAVGDQGAIERDDWDLYRNTGVAHLVSISGLHITMFAWLSRRVDRCAVAPQCRALALWLPVPHAARWGGLALAIAYALFSGWGVPAQRTVWMLATVTLLQALGLRWPWVLVLLTAAVVVTALDPWALLQAGFWLSFAAVGLLMASAAACGECRRPARRSLRLAPLAAAALRRGCAPACAPS